MDKQLNTHDLFRACNKILGVPAMMEVFHRGQAQIYDYAKPLQRGGQINPMDRMEMLLDDLKNYGGDDGLHTGRTIVARMAALLGCRLVDMAPAHPNRSTVEGECVDDLPALAALHAAICCPDPNYPDVLEKYELMQRELAETLEKFREKMMAEEI